MDFRPSLYLRHTEPNPPVADTQAPVHHRSHNFASTPALHARSSSGQPVPPTESAEEIDTSTRPRLTQEQVTVLEEEFSKLPKPNTDFKKELASRIGLTLARVNVSS